MSSGALRPSAFVDERGGVGIRLRPAAAIVRQYGEQFRRPRRKANTPDTETTASAVNWSPWVLLKVVYGALLVGGELAVLALPSKRTGSPLQVVRLDRAAALCLGAHVARFDELAGFGCTGRGRMDVVFRFFCMVVVVPDRGAVKRVRIIDF
jgi:hypothetical protein